MCVLSCHRQVLLDAIHASYADQTVQKEPQFGRCISDVSTTERDVLEEIELENLKANSLWRNYLSHDASPITDVFAGQLQIVRVCQKCHCRSTTYEPFWDLSLSLCRERVSWFNPGRMPGSLDDLMRAFTAAEVLQGEEAPYCDCCEQKSPATRRILIHRFPKVLVINIKRFKYTKDGREKLTSNITFPSRALRLHVRSTSSTTTSPWDKIFPCDRTLHPKSTSTKGFQRSMICTPSAITTVHWGEGTTQLSARYVLDGPTRGSSLARVRVYR